MPHTLSYYLLQPLRQWKAGMLDCMPAGLRDKLAPEIKPYVLELNIDQARLYRQHEQAEQQLGTMYLKDGHVDAGLASILVSRQAPLLLLLPSAWVLRKQISLPAAAQENLGQVIRFEMDRLTPFSADQVYYDYHVEPQSSAEELLSVTVALLPRKKIEAWLSLLDAANIRLDQISTETLWPGANFLPEEARSGTSIKQAALQTVPVVLVAVLLFVAMALPLWQKHNVAQAMKDKEAPLKKQANQVIQIREQLQAELERQRQLHAAWTQYPPAVDVVKVLTDLLPDDTSLQQMDIKGSQLIIRGISSQASSLIKLLEESTGFSDAKFMSSVVQQRGKEQFHLAANIVMPFVKIDSTVLPEEESTAEDAEEGSAESAGDETTEPQVLADNEEKTASEETGEVSTAVVAVSEEPAGNETTEPQALSSDEEKTASEETGAMSTDTIAEPASAAEVAPQEGAGE